MLYETKFLISLLATIILELPIIFIFIRHIFKIKNLSIGNIIFSGILASVLTLPYLWFVLPPFIKSNYYILFGELIVILVESLVYNKMFKLRIEKSFVLSLTANLFSYIVGLFYSNFFLI